MTDFVFYRCIFKMREIHILQSSEVQSFEKFSKVMNRESLIALAVFGSLSVFSIIQITFEIFDYIIT